MGARLLSETPGRLFPAGDKLIESAEYFGFDGWFFNQETAGGNAADAAAMRDLIKYVRDHSNIRITWVRFHDRIGRHLLAGSF